MAESHARPRSAHAAVTIVFALFFAYDLWEAISNLVELPIAYANAGFASETPWGLLVANLFVPIVTFLLALYLARARSLGERAILLFAALCVSAVFSLDAIALVAVL